MRMARTCEVCGKASFVKVEVSAFRAKLVVEMVHFFERPPANETFLLPKERSCTVSTCTFLHVGEDTGVVYERWVGMGAGSDAGGVYACIAVACIVPTQQRPPTGDEHQRRQALLFMCVCVRALLCAHVWTLTQGARAIEK